MGVSVLSALSAAAPSQAPPCAVQPHLEGPASVPAEAGADVKEAFAKLRLQVRKTSRPLFISLFCAIARFLVLEGIAKFKRRKCTAQGSEC